MKKLTLFVLIFLIGCSDPMNEFAPMEHQSHLTFDQKQSRKQNLFSKRLEIQELMSSDIFKNVIPEFLGKHEIDRTIVIDTKPGTVVALSPISIKSKTSGLIISTISKDQWRHKLIIRNQLAEYYKYYTNYNGPSQKSINEIFDYYDKHSSITGASNGTLSDTKSLSHPSQVSEINIQTKSTVKSEWVKICEGQDFLYKSDDGIIIEEEVGIHCFWVYSWDDPPGAVIYLDGLGGGGGGTYTVIRFEDKITDSGLADCLKSILADIKSLQNGAGDIIQEFNGPSSSGFNWDVQSGDTGDFNALTSTDYNNGVKTTFSNSKFANATDISVARTFLHEALHGYFVSIAKNTTLTFEQKGALLGKNWFSVAGLLIDNQGHGLMARDYVQLVGSALFEFSNNRSIGVTQEYCNDLAWGGLTHYRKSETSPWEISPWFKNNVTDPLVRQKILDNISKEINGTNGKKGNDAGC